MLNNGRFLLFLDILGFKELVKSKGALEIYAIIDNALMSFDRWEALNRSFKTIHFSDTFIFYHEPKGYSRAGFFDIYAISGMILSALLASKIPARGVVSFGEFEVNFDSTGRHQVYFGQALIDAHEAEQSEKWVGVTILPSAWEPCESQDPGLVDAFARERVWLKRDDGTLLLNPFIKLRGWGFASLTKSDMPSPPYSQWDAPEFPNDILGFKFLREQAAIYAGKNDFASPIAIKYHATILFLERILGQELYEWGVNAALPSNFGDWANLSCQD